MILVLKFFKNQGKTEKIEKVAAQSSDQFDFDLGARSCSEIFRFASLSSPSVPLLPRHANQYLFEGKIIFYLKFS